MGVLVFAGMILRGCAAVMRETKPLSNTPSYSPPAHFPKYTDEQIRMYRAYDPKSGKPAPPGYTAWWMETSQFNRKSPAP